jgi:hypothetical protein
MGREGFSLRVPGVCDRLRRLPSAPSVSAGASQTRFLRLRSVAQTASRPLPGSTSSPRLDTWTPQAESSSTCDIRCGCVVQLHSNRVFLIHCLISLMLVFSFCFRRMFDVLFCVFLDVYFKLGVISIGGFLNVLLIVCSTIVISQKQCVFEYCSDDAKNP